MDIKLENGKNLVSDFTYDKADNEEDSVSTLSEIDTDTFDTENADDTSEIETNHKKKSAVKRVFFDILFYVVLIFTCIYIIPNFVLQRTIVDGESMENTLSNGDHLYVEKITYRMDLLKRFDIIVFYPYGRENEEYYVKRIIGLPGETIQIIDGDIYINGEIVEEDFGKEPIRDPGRAAQPIVLGEDEYFVMGDNRNISKDSRYPGVGNVQKKNIGGKAFFRVSPLKKFGPIE